MSLDHCLPPESMPVTADEQEDIRKSAGTDLHTQSILEMLQNKGIIFQPFFVGRFVLLYFAL